jgi:hypothetical protein
MASSEAVILPVPTTLTGHSFQVVPNNPGVVDTGLQPTDLQVRSVTISGHDSLGVSFSTPVGGIKVAQSFLTGYGVVFTSNCQSGQACSGQDAIVRMASNFAGVLFGNKAVRFCVQRGDFQFVIPATATKPESLASCFDTVTDHEGIALGRIRVPASAPSQIAILRIFDTATGVYIDQLFTITAGGAKGTLTIIPNDMTFTGPRAGVCGTGSNDILIFDGQPPYTATSTDPNVTVTAVNANTNPGRFTITAINPGLPCLDHKNVVIQDSGGLRATVTVSSAEGSGTLPPLAVSPTTVDLNDTCGYSVSVTAIGGTGAISATAQHPRLSASVAANTVTITRALHDVPFPPPVPFPTTGTVSITDGSTIVSVTANNVAPACP